MQCGAMGGLVVKKHNMVEWSLLHLPTFRSARKSARKLAWKSAYKSQSLLYSSNICRHPRWCKGRSLVVQTTWLSDCSRVELASGEISFRFLACQPDGAATACLITTYWSYTAVTLRCSMHHGHAMYENILHDITRLPESTYTGAGISQNF